MSFLLFVASPSKELLLIKYQKCLNAQISSPTTTPSPPHPNLNVENYAIRRSFKFYKAQIFEMEVLLFTEDSDSEFGSILAGQAGVGWGMDLVVLKDKNRTFLHWIKFVS